MLQRLSVRGKILLLAGFLATLLIGGSVAFFLELQFARGFAQEMRDVHFRGFLRVWDLRSVFGKSQDGIQALIATKNPDAATKIHKDLDGLEKKSKDTLAEIENSPLKTAGAEQVKKMELARSRLFALISKVRQAKLEGDDKAASDLVAAEMPGAARDFRDNVNELLIIETSFLEDRERKQEQKLLILPSLSLLINVIGIIFAAILTFLVIRSIAKPIERLRSILAELAKGEGDLRFRIALNSTDEIGILSQDFDRFMATLQKIIALIQQASIALSEQTAHAQDVANRVSDGTQTQASAIEETSAAMEQIASSVDSVAEMTNENVKEVAHAESLIREIESLAKPIYDHSEKISIEGELILQSLSVIRDMLSKTTESMNQISESTRSVVEIIGVMDDIADRISLLALNASIEAARAGEAGRGFAVVAHEVSRLSDQSTSSFKGIEELVRKSAGSVQSGTTNVQEIEAMIVSLDRSISGMISRVTTSREFSQNQTQKASRALSAVSVVARSSSKINDAAAEQRIGAQAIGQSIGEINRIAEQGVDTVHQLLKLSQELSEHSKILREQTNQFKV